MASKPPTRPIPYPIAHPSNNQPTDQQLTRGEALGIGYSLTISGVRNGAVGPRYGTVMESDDVRMCLASDAMNVVPDRSGRTSYDGVRQQSFDAVRGDDRSG